MPRTCGLLNSLSGWFGMRGSTVIIDTPATLTAILD
jgi:hypothetical protein